MPFEVISSSGNLISVKITGELKVEIQYFIPSQFDQARTWIA